VRMRFALAIVATVELCGELIVAFAQRGERRVLRVRGRSPSSVKALRVGSAVGLV
jgi:hypothetical protein